MQTPESKTTPPFEIISECVSRYLSAAERAYKEHEQATNEIMEALEKGGYTICQKKQ